MKRFSLISLLLLFCLFAKAQKFMEIQDKTFYWGAKVGFNTTFPNINSLTINDIEAEDVHLEYRVGYLAALFCRVNMDRFFIQPSLSWHRSEGDIYFNMPGVDNPSEENPSYSSTADHLGMQVKSLEVPVMVGYHIVQQGPYGLSLMAGPKLKYNYRVNYTSHFNNETREYIGDNSPFAINLSTGIGVSIWRLFFDFVYEFGFNHVDSKFTYPDKLNPTSAPALRVGKRTNVMSFSLGFLF